MNEASKLISKLQEENIILNTHSTMLRMLLLEVVSKFPGETRFQTAQRYIQEAERRQECGSGSNPSTFAV